MSTPKERGAREPDFIEISGAREHNLVIDSLRIPKRQLVVFTGPSGSGKSSLAFDTLYAEGQRRYIETLSSYARQFLGQLDRPKVEHLRGLSPTIAIEQKSASSNPRSTVGTITEIYDYLRVLYAKVGEQFCPKCGQKVASMGGGEAQRVKLSRELGKAQTGRTLYVLDEPTTGLHFEDILQLLAVLQALVDAGNSVVVIEHNLDVIKCADWVIDLGPEGGARGGRLLAEGTPETVAKNAASFTGVHLAPLLSRARGQRLAGPVTSSFPRAPGAASSTPPR